MTDMMREAARTALLEELIQICYAPVLCGRPIGVEDDFFSIGGDSVDLMRVVAAAQDHFDVELEIVDFFEEPTLSRLADMVTRRRGVPR